MVNNLFPTAPTLPDTEDINTLFPSVSTQEVTKPEQLPDVYLEDLAERWSVKTLTPYGDMLTVVKNVGPDGVLTTSEPINLTQDVVDYGFKNNLSPEALKAIYEDKLQAQSFVNAAGVNKDIVERTGDNLPWKEKTYEQKRAFYTAKIRDNYNKNFAGKGFLGSAVDFLAMLGYEATWGVGQSAFGYRASTAQDFVDKLDAAQSPEEAEAVINSVFEEALSRGLYGNNIFNTTYAVDTFVADGSNAHEGTQFLLDAATLGGGYFIKALKGTTSLARGTLLGTARDSADIGFSVKGLREADAALTASLQSGSGGVQLARQGSIAANRVAIPSPANLVGPSVQPVLFYEKQNYILKAIRSSYWATGQDEALLLENANAQANVWMKNANLSFVNMTFEEIDELGTNKKVLFQFGKDTGGSFLTKESAEKAAKYIGGQVLELPNKKEWLVLKAENLNTKMTGKVTKENELVYRLLGDYMSPEQTSKLSNLGLAKQGDMRLNYMMSVIQPNYNKALKAINTRALKVDKERLNVFVRELQDSGRDRAYSVTEFEREWFIRHGENPDPKITEAYSQVMFMNDAQYLLKADVELSRYAESGTEIVNFKALGEKKAIAFAKIPGTNRMERLINVDTGEVTSIDAALKAGKSVYKLDEPFEFGGKTLTYLTGDVSNVRPMNHYDALAYNPGGVREINARYVVSQITKGVDISDKPVTLMPRIVYATGSQADADKAVRQINTIIQKIRQSTGGLDLSSVRAFKTSIAKTSVDDINKVILANNDFNPSIENFDDFIKMSEDTGLDFVSDLKATAADAKLNEKDISGLQSRIITTNSTFMDVYRHQHNTYGDRFKTVMPYNYNGSIIDPIRAIERDFSREINRKRQAEYFKTSIEGLLRGAEENNVLIGSLDDLKKMPLSAQLNEVRIDTSSKIGKKYDQERRTILRKMNEKSQMAQNWEYGINALAERIFDKGIFGFGKGKYWSILDKFSTDPVVAVRGWAFDMKLGLFALDQLIVQTSQIPNIIAISKYGAEAFAELPALRIALADGRFKTISHIGHKLQGVTSRLSKQEFEEMVEYIQNSGAKKIGFNISELDAPESVGYGIIDSIRKAGRAPFNEGDRLTRLAAYSAAYREWKVANPTLSVKTKEGLASADAFIVSRADALTAHMTGVSAAVWQKGVLSLGTQFYSYTARVFEQLAFGRTLTGPERRRLAAAQFIMYGTTGLGVGWTVDKFMYETDTSIDPRVYTATKYGMMDYLIGEMTGVDTAFAERFSMGSAINDMYQKIADESFVEVISGPVGSIGYDVLSSGFRAMYTLATGYPTTAQSDFKKLWMNVSGLSKPTQAWVILNTGEFETKNGKLRAKGLTPGYAAALMAGARFQVDTTQYDFTSLKKNEDEFIREMSKRIQELTSNATKAYAEGRDSEAEEIFNQIANLYKATNPYQRGRILNSQRESVNSTMETLMLEMQRRNKSAIFNQLQQLNTEGIE